MLNHQRELTLPRPTAAPTATSSVCFLTRQFLWRQADALVFTKCARSRTMSVGLLSYTFLRATRAQDVVVPTVDWTAAHAPGRSTLFSRGGT